MAQYIIEQIHFEDAGRFEFRLQFIYRGQVLQTVPFDKQFADTPENAAKRLAVEAVAICKDFDTRSGGKMFSTLKSQFEGTTQTLEG